jgi:hypothetical protein
MKTMRFYLDPHDRIQDFSEKTVAEDFEKFYALYEKACYDENVVPIRVHASYEDGRAFCLNMAVSAGSVKRTHERVGLPYDAIIEVATATPGDTFFRRKAA